MASAWNTPDPSKPNYVRPEVQKVRTDLELMADLIAGTRRMWERSQVANYIRKWADEKTAIYHIRRQSETVFEGVARTLSAAVGMLFAKPPVVEWNASEAAMDEHWEDLDGAGTSGPVLCKRFADQSIRDGLGLILVDHPAPPKDVDVVTEAVAQEFNLRPQWALYQRYYAISWRVGRVNNRAEPTQVVLEECDYAEAGQFGVVERKRYRVLQLVTRAPGTLNVLDPGGPMATWELFEETKDGTVYGFKSVGKGVFKNINGEPAATLPIAVAYTGRTDAPFCASIPLLGVAFANLAHWQLSTNLRFYCDLAAFPQPTVTGELASTTVQAAGGNATTMPGKLQIGPAVAVMLKGADSKYSFTAPPTDAFAPLEVRIQEKRQQIGEMGMSFLTPDTRAAETAEAKRLDAAAENSTLATAAQGIEDALNRALEIHAWYLGIEAEGAPVLTINKDFEATVMEPAVMLAYITAAKEVGFPVSQVLKIFQQGGRLPLDTDLDALELEMAANAAAEAERQRQAAEDRGVRGAGDPMRLTETRRLGDVEVTRTVEMGDDIDAFARTDVLRWLRDWGEPAKETFA
jgi:hypothetical protein